MASYTVGGNIDSWCGKCKLLLAHTIEAMLNGVAKKVQCNTCNAKHGYRKDPSAAKTARASSRTKTATSKATLKSSDYDSYMRGKDTSLAKTYKMSEKFVQGQVMTHKMFGFGIVTSTKGQFKVEVLFKEGPKTLIHAKIV